MSKKIKIKSAPGTNPPNNTEGTVDLVDPGLYFEEVGTSGNYLLYAPSKAQPPGPAQVIVTDPTPLTPTTTSFTFNWMGDFWTITNFLMSISQTTSTASGSWAAESEESTHEMPTEGDVETGTFQANDTVDDVAADSASASA